MWYNTHDLSCTVQCSVSHSLLDQDDACEIQSPQPALRRTCTHRVRELRCALKDGSQTAKRHPHGPGGEFEVRGGVTVVSAKQAHG